MLQQVVNSLKKLTGLDLADRNTLILLVLAAVLIHCTLNGCPQVRGAIQSVKSQVQGVLGGVLDGNRTEESYIQY